MLNDLAIRFRRTRVPTRFEQKYVLRGVHLELGGVKSDEATHEGDLVGETQSIVAAPPQGDLASAGFEKAGIANQTGAREVPDGTLEAFALAAGSVPPATPGSPRSSLPD